jgi:hypothetical protein
MLVWLVPEYISYPMAALLVMAVDPVLVPR